ncbi:MAG: tRNA (adenine(22)-N(1))-methyltransferase TrmK [Candidatus Dormibacteria bacterium]
MTTTTPIPAAPPAGTVVPVPVPRRGPARMGPRLRALLDLCPPGGPVADVGSGHGRLALELKRRAPHLEVYATELRAGPAGELRRLLSDRSGVRILEGEGLVPLAGLGCRGAVIAGMGGNTLARILERDRELARQLDWICLQPAQRRGRLEDWLQAERWYPCEQRQVVERGHAYQTYLVAPR